MTDTITRLRALWQRKPHTMPIGASIRNSHFILMFSSTTSASLPLGHDSTTEIILALAEHRLMDLLPEFRSVYKNPGRWGVHSVHYATGPGPTWTGKTLLDALLSWAESEECHE